MIQESALPQLHKNIYFFYLVDMNERSFGEERLSIVLNTLKNCTVLNFGFLVQIWYLRWCDIFCLQKPYNKLYKFCAAVESECIPFLAIFMSLNYTAPDPTW